jgi:hypothetical protein
LQEFLQNDRQTWQNAAMFRAFRTPSGQHKQTETGCIPKMRVPSDRLPLEHALCHIQHAIRKASFVVIPAKHPQHALRRDPRLGAGHHDTFCSRAGLQEQVPRKIPKHLWTLVFRGEYLESWDVKVQGGDEADQDQGERGHLTHPRPFITTQVKHVQPARRGSAGCVSPLEMVSHFHVCPGHSATVRTQISRRPH